MLGVPFLAAACRRPAGVVIGTALNAALLFARRATANPDQLSHTTEPLKLLANRLLYDRDSAR